MQSTTYILLFPLQFVVVFCDADFIRFNSPAHLPYPQLCLAVFRNHASSEPAWDSRTGKTRNVAYLDGRIIIVGSKYVFNMTAVNRRAKSSGSGTMTSCRTSHIASTVACLPRVVGSIDER